MILKKNMSLCVMLPKMRACRKDYEETKFMSFLIKSNKLLEKHNEIWDKVNNIIKKGSDSGHDIMKIFKI